MKKFIISLLITMLSVASGTMNAQSLMKQFKGNKNYTCVTVSAMAMKLLPGSATVGSTKISGLKDKISKLEIITANNPQAGIELMKQCDKWIEKQNFESLVDVDDEGQKAGIFFKSDGPQSIFLLKSIDEEDASLVILYGSMTIDDIKAITEQ